MKTFKKTFGIAACIGILAASATSVFAQGITLAQLATNNGTLSIGDKTFTNFSYQASGLTSFDPSQIIVTATESVGIDYLIWSGNISLVSSSFAAADLLLKYKVIANAGKIDWIDQSYTGIAINGWLYIDEAATNGAFGGGGGWSHLEIGDTNDPPVETVQGDNLIINPSQSGLYVTVDIELAVIGGSVTIDQVSQSFHQSGIVLATPVVTGNQVQLNFTVISSLTNATLNLLQTGQLGTGWTTNTTATLTTNVSGISYCFTATNIAAAQFYRIQIGP